jgi:hypothetical protein
LANRRPTRCGMAIFASDRESAMRVSHAARITCLSAGRDRKTNPQTGKKYTPAPQPLARLPCQCPPMLTCSASAIQVQPIFFSTVRCRSILPQRLQCGK